jgi:group I intron endonuclease
MYYILYQITNIINNKIYIGVHKTHDLDDGYMGSGKVICSAINKYGIENFIKTILEVFDNEQEMYAREKEVVTEEFLLRENVYNLRKGGSGGFDYINRMRLNDRTGEKRTAEQRAKMSHTVSDEHRVYWSRVMSTDQNPMKDKEIATKVSIALTGKAKTEEHKEKLKQSATGKQRKQRKGTYTLKSGRRYSVPRIMTETSCPYCGKTGKLNAMKRWHFYNCKINKNVRV